MLFRSPNGALPWVRGRAYTRPTRYGLRITLDNDCDNDYDNDLKPEPFSSLHGFTMPASPDFSLPSFMDAFTSAEEGALTQSRR